MASTTITMPQLGETVTEGTVSQWLKKVGDPIEKYESFVEVTTDKVNAEVPAPVTGILTQIIAKEGETVPTGAPIAIIEETASSGLEVTEAATATIASIAEKRSEADRQGADEPVPGHNFGVPHAPSRNGGAVNSPEILRRVSPAVRRLAREHHIDVASLRGTGLNGRVTANDVLAASSQGPSAAMAAAITSAPPPPSAAPRPASPTPPANAKTSYGAPLLGETIPLSQIRKIIAQRMVESKHTAPHAWTMVEVDVSGVWKWRAAEKDRFAREKSYPLTLLPFFIHAVVQSLRAFPLMNARFTEEGILVHREINVGLAVAADANLVVPVIRDADNYSIAGLAVAAGKLIERARSNKLGADDLSGGTFTVNNTGANGSVMSAPIINGGQAGIVTMEAVVKRPIVTKDDAIAIRSMMNVCLSLDHRVIDGSIASAFLVDLKKRLEAMTPGGSL
jgi:2-oxoisovalerate dehydrogenase E2 component (dihydrolipoyl transacylase)